jgi:hypothetical protein
MTAAEAIECSTKYTACGEAYDYAWPNEILSDSLDVRTDYQNARRRGHYFSESALRFFGSRNFATVAPGASVELQANAPGDRYKVNVWKVGEEGEGPQPWFGCWHATRAGAVRCAKATAEALRA